MRHPSAPRKTSNACPTRRCPYEADTEITGHPILHLFVSSTAPDGDFFVYLEDVDENGEALLVTEGQLRAGFAVLRNNDKMILAGTKGIDVKPELPWHGFEKNDWNPEVFANDAVVELVIDYFPNVMGLPERAPTPRDHRLCGLSHLPPESGHQPEE